MTTTHSDLLDMVAIATHAKTVDDIEMIRKAQGARYGALTGYTPSGDPWKPDKDGAQRVIGLARDNPSVVELASIIDAMTDVEEMAVKHLERAVKKHPLGPWVKARKGLGEKQIGRLLAEIGDPYWRDERTYRDDDGNPIRTVPEGPRMVSSLWAYSGLHVVPGGRPASDSQVTIAVGDDEGGDHDREISETQNSTVTMVAARRQKGVKANWSPAAKTRAYLCAVSCLKQKAKTCESGVSERGWAAVHRPDCLCSPYRILYDVRRARTSTDRPTWTDAHRHMDALRIVAKRVLRDLWAESARLHLEFDPELKNRSDSYLHLEGPDGPRTP